MSSKVIIIGSGVAGLATSIRLARKGYDVQVFEANSYPGGKLSAFKLGAYRFDAGPSLFTMPQFVEELFEICDENPKDYFEYSKKEIGCSYFWEDGTRLNAYDNQELFLSEVESVLGVSPKVVGDYLKKAKKKYDLTESIFLKRSLHKLKSFLNSKTLKAILQIRTLELGKSLHQINLEQLKEPHLVQFFDRFATYNGSNPYQTPGIMTLIQHLENHYGTFVPKKGMESITSSLFELAKRQGVDFHFNEKVNQIVVENQKSVGVKTANAFYPADKICSNMDIYPTYKQLLNKKFEPSKILEQERSSSAIIFYWGISREFRELDLHNIFFSDDYEKEFKAIFEEKKVTEDPTIYVNITSKDISSDAPKGCENWFVMINTPPDSGQDWNEIVEFVRVNVLKKLSRILEVNLQDFIVEEDLLTPPSIQQKTESHQGALYGSSSNAKMAAFLRHPNFSQQIKNLYFCGGSVHPGGGIPLCLLSAKIVSDQIPHKN
ncbi:MAG: phytoene dehydrogenase [Flavobacteriales bacterium]|nr:phytoene dehydrogenase [Candidatus Arcticimaribacter sp.]|tara:strand:+ start:2027 stop:3499 length:1473 start_codon:yes stop_codon:yes gene_type:complete